MNLLRLSRLASAALVLALSSAVGVADTAGFVLADGVLVEKAARRLHLLKNDRVLKSYPISLGLSPKGPKEREGDFRTPEGSYVLGQRNSKSDYFLAIQISYPNDQDRRRAQQLGVEPGGQIMIHGQPNEPRHTPEYYGSRDWTDGCIAVSNGDMVEIWLMTADNTPIEIRP